MEAALVALEHAGIEQQEGMRAYFLLTNFTLGQVSYEIRGPFRGLDPAEAVRDRSILPIDFPLPDSQHVPRGVLVRPELGAAHERAAT